jgi:hypothetical protein
MTMLVSQIEMPRSPSLRRPAVTLLAGAALASLFLLVATLAGPGPSIADWLGDPDDALRLVGVRELLSGAPWFDTTMPRLGAPEALVSHWSRLIDLPHALLIAMLTPALGSEGAELLTRTLWPVLLFFALALIVAREAHRRGGMLAAGVALALMATSSTALAQFRPGRIDHHNAQILCAVAGLILLSRNSPDRRAAWIAGALIGLGLAIGYEALALIVLALGIAAFIAVWEPRNGTAVAHAATAATVVLVFALAATVPPGRWLDVRCDALSLNLAVLAAYGTAGLWAAMLGSPRRLVRFAILGAAVIAGSLAYAALEPACLAGPFGQVGAALKPLWLDQVTETKSIFWLAASAPGSALAAGIFVAAGACAQFALWRRNPSANGVLATAVVVLAAGLGCWQLKLLPYAAWLAIVPLAVWAAGLRGNATISAPVMRMAAVILLSQSALDAAGSAFAAPFQNPASRGTSAVESADPRRPCFLSANVRHLAALPAGLIAGDLDLGPYIVAFSPHRVVAAPYHRLETGIIANYAILRGTPEAAEGHLRALGATYVVLCADRRDGARQAARPSDGPLRARLLGGGRVPFLQEVPMTGETAIRVWRVTPSP